MKNRLTVRTTMRPDEEIEVTEQEATDLYRSGLLLNEEPPADVEPEPRVARRRTETEGTNA